MRQATAKIDENDIRPGHHEGMSSNGETPELATNKLWCDDMAVARKKKGWTQRQLGKLVGTSQNVISLIEAGRVHTSQFVKPISKQLGLSLPAHYGNDEERVWADLGRALKAKSAARYDLVLQVAMAMLDESGSAGRGLLSLNTRIFAPTRNATRRQKID